MTADQHIALLESTKGQLLRQREQLEDKITHIKERAKKREELEMERESMSKKGKFSEGMGRS
jgi:hypothetical protein